MYVIPVVYVPLPMITHVAAFYLDNRVKYEYRIRPEGL
jgi:hypothetical protein